MAPYISAKRNEACDLVFDTASKGKQFLIVGTKNKAVDSVVRIAIRARCHYVNKKWLGGMDLRTEQKTGGLNRLPKRDATMLKRQLSRLQTYLGGIKYMTRLLDIVIIVDQQEKYTTLRECITLGIPTIYISISVNDDVIASIRLILNKLIVTICESRSSYIENPSLIIR
ncbi:hypothetical protein ES288_A05G341400v1 [Gossypium darwinii]|uniref:Small ribosomal subunit protein uS2c n=1 Tax=Gossypium darwinii TaxID=34276 RepID=A0A5D2GPT7_GOSDA|nr:hypothetical protein ES288_A05G341400v1 [Gossypium darwinii]